MSSSRSSWSFPEFEPEEWVPNLRNMELPDWGNVDGTLSGRVRKMDLDNVVKEYFSEDDTVIEVGCAQGYTSIEIANISEAEVIGVDVPEAFSQGVPGNKYGEGSQPGFITGVAPSLPVKDESVDGIAALNSVTYLARSLGSVAAETEEKASSWQKERFEDFYTQSVASDLMEDFERVTKDGGYLLLGEQTDSSYLLLEKDGDSWIVGDCGSFPDHDGENIHRRYRPWIEDGNVEY